MLIAVTLAILLGLDVARRFLPMLLRDDLNSGDAAQHTWWLYRFVDPELFPNDLAAHYMSQLIYSTPAYQAIFRATAGWIDPLRLSEGLAIGLAILTGIFACAVGRRVGGWGGAGAALIAYLALGLVYLHEGGFPRTFGLSLLLAGMWAIISRQWLWLGVVFIACAVIYPPMVLNLVPVAGVIFVWEVAHVIRSHRGQIEAERVPLLTSDRVIFVALGLIAAAIIGYVYLRPLPADIGTFYSYEETRAMPEWRASGRSAFYRGPTAFYYHGSTSGIGLERSELIIALVLLGATLAFFHRAIAVEAWLLLLSAVGMWALAHAMMFRLYLPSRYTTYALPVFAILWAAGLAREIAPLFSRWSFLRRPTYVAAVCALVLVPSIFWSVNRIDTDLHAESSWAPPVGYEDALLAIRKLPKDVLIASHPIDANAIPLRAHRSVLVNNEVSIAYNRAYYDEMKKRLLASFAMLYAVDWREVDKLADEFGVNVFLVNQDRLRDPEALPYYEPFRTSNRPLIARGREQGFVMLDVPLDRVIMRDGSVVLVRVGKKGFR